MYEGQGKWKRLDSLFAVKSNQFISHHLGDRGMFPGRFALPGFGWKCFLAKRGLNLSVLMQVKAVSTSMRVLFASGQQGRALKCSLV